MKNNVLYLFIFLFQHSISFSIICEQIFTLKELERQKQTNSLFWHYSFPTTGMLLEKPFYPPRYPFLPHFFSLWQLAPKKGSGVTVAVIDGLEKDFQAHHDMPSIELIPLTKTTKKFPKLQNTCRTPHAYHSAGIIAGRMDDNKADTPVHDTGIAGIAPNARIVYINAFSCNQESRKSILITALEKALKNHVQVVNAAFKINELDITEQSSKKLAHLVAKVPYFIAAAGNNDTVDDWQRMGRIYAYPARFESVPFDVGAFGYDGKRAFIPDFSQYKSDIGPLFVAPGVDILGAQCVLNNESLYYAASGTSVASAIMSGFVALMLAEFKNDFTRAQMLKVCYLSTIKLHNNHEWHTKVVLGVLDMRLALFVLHVLRSLKQALRHNKTTLFNITTQFDQALNAVLFILLYDVDQYAQQLQSARFKYNFMHYFECANSANWEKHKSSFFIPESTKTGLDHAIEYVTNIILMALNVKKTENAYYTIIGSVRKILKSQSVHLFPDISNGVDERLKIKLIDSGE